MTYKYPFIVTNRVLNPAEALQFLAYRFGFDGIALRRVTNFGIYFFDVKYFNSGLRLKPNPIAKIDCVPQSDILTPPKNGGIRLESFRVDINEDQKNFLEQLGVIARNIDHQELLQLDIRDKKEQYELHNN